MPSRKSTFALGEYYHLYSRGVDKRIIFLDDSDRKRFIRLLYLCNGTNPLVYKEIRNKELANISIGERLTAVGAYCLMPNHFHILVKEVEEMGTVKFMGKLLTAYSKYFNKKYERTGSLFESEFKSKHLNRDEYLKYIFSYIHLNPMKIFDLNWKEKIMDKKTVEKFLEGYTFSSYGDYLGKKRDCSIILTPQVFPEYFFESQDLKSEMLNWVNLNFNFTEDSIQPLA